MSALPAGPRPLRFRGRGRGGDLLRGNAGRGKGIGAALTAPGGTPHGIPDRNPAIVRDGISRV